MSDFRTRRLDELMAAGEIYLGRGDVISKDDIANHPGPYPIYSSSAQNNGLFGEYGKFMFDEELISWSVDGGGYFFYRPKQRYSVTNVCGYMRIRPESWHPKFVYYSLVNQHRFLTFDYTSKAHPSVIKKQYRLPAIDVARQQKIASILSTIDTAIEQTEALIEKCQHIKAGLMHDLFTRGVLPNGQLRPPREQAPELYQETAIGWIPREWRLTNAGDVAQSIVPGRDKPEMDGGRIPWITVADLDSFYVYKSKAGLSISDQAIKRSGGRIIPANAVILSCVGDFGSAAVTSCDITMNQQLHAFLPSEDLKPEWLAYCINRQKRYMERVATQTTIKYLNKAGCESIPIPVPSLSEQMLLLERLTEVSKVIQGCAEFSQKLQTQKLGLMQDLLTGKVPVTVDAPPSEAVA